MRLALLLPILAVACGEYVRVGDEVAAPESMTSTVPDAGVTAPVDGGAAVVAPSQRRCTPGSRFQAMTKVTLPAGVSSVENLSLSGAGMGVLALGSQSSGMPIRIFGFDGDRLGIPSSPGPGFDTSELDFLAQPVLSLDARTLFLARLGTTTAGDLLFSRRDPGAAFPAPEPILHPGLNASLFGPYPAGSSLYFSRLQGTDDERISSGSFDPTTGTLGAVRDVGLMPSLTGAHWSPVVSDDELEIFFASSPITTTSLTMHATRTSIAGDFGAPSPLEQIPMTTNGFDYPTWVSPDACTLFVVSRHGTGASDLWRATRL